METPRIPFATLFVVLPLVAGATPILKIVRPTKSPTTNSLLNASGTATGTAPVAVYYSLNGSPWTNATGTTNWSVTNLTLTPGPNTFSAYAMDATAGVSKTNSVKFTFVVDVPITVLTNGNGKVTPNYNGKLLQIGKEYVLNAKPTKGFGFVNWSLNDHPIVAVPHVFFIMESNLSFTANFADITRPLCGVTYPSANQSVSNSPITVTGQASDNVEVTNVSYQLNGGGWNSAVVEDGTNWGATNISLTIGGNLVEARSEDAAGNFSIINAVIFDYVPAVLPPVGPAPASLAGTVAQVTFSNGVAPSQICFDTSTFALTTTDTNEPTFVGNYTFTLSSSNIAQLNLNILLPPELANAGDELLLTFTDSSDCTFMDNNGNTGSITFSAASNSAPSASSIIIAEYVDALNNTNTITFGGGLFTNVDSVGDTNWGACIVQSFSPQDLMLTEYFMDPLMSGDTGYLQLDFSDPVHGDFSSKEFENRTNLLNSDKGSFSITSSAGQSAGNAPDSVAGLICNVTPKGGSEYQFCFGRSTYSRTSSNTNQNDIGDYSYVKTGANTAQFAQIEVPSLQGGSGSNSTSLASFTFSNTNTGTFTVTNNDNGTTNVVTGTLKFSTAGSFAPSLLAGKTLILKSKRAMSTITLNTDGSFTLSSSSGINDAGRYIYAQYSPIGGMVSWFVASAGEDIGKITYVELTFTSSNGGNAFISTSGSGGNLNISQSGTFTLK